MRILLVRLEGKEHKEMLVFVKKLQVSALYTKGVSDTMVEVIHES